MVRKEIVRQYVENDLKVKAVTGDPINIEGQMLDAYLKLHAHKYLGTAQR